MSTDVKAWLIGWNRSLKTKANYHGLLRRLQLRPRAGLHHAQPLPPHGTERSRIRQSQADLRFLTEQEFARERHQISDTAAALARDALLTSPNRA
jgi:hypothetical protein